VFGNLPRKDLQKHVNYVNLKSINTGLCKRFQMPTTLRQYRIELGWTINRLAQKAGLARQTAASAEEGKPIQAPTAKALAEALSKGYGREIKVLDIEGLNIH
jgi:DNA-binding XRE family transcriptional regulator